ncbi:c-type cytochrome, partial [Marinimicrobium sp. UBA4509]
DAGVSGAPMLGSVDDWASRIEKGSETLYDHAINGFNAMPAMGLCSDCSDEEIQATVDYMVEESS